MKTVTITHPTDATPLIEYCANIVGRDNITVCKYNTIYERFSNTDFNLKLCPSKIEVKNMPEMYEVLLALEIVKHEDCKIFWG